MIGDDAGRALDRAAAAEDADEETAKAVEAISGEEAADQRRGLPTATVLRRSGDDGRRSRL